MVAVLSVVTLDIWMKYSPNFSSGFGTEDSFDPYFILVKLLIDQSQFSKPDSNPHFLLTAKGSEYVNETPVLLLTPN